MEISLRNSAKAIIIQDGKVLLLNKQHPNSPAFTVFPGGGQEPGETLHDALIRECLEEIGAHVDVGDLMFLREYRSWMHEFDNPAVKQHQVEFFFKCRLVDGVQAQLPSNPDPEQIGVVWVGLNELEDANLYPKALRKALPLKLKAWDQAESTATYLGGVN